MSNFATFDNPTQADNKSESLSRFPNAFINHQNNQVTRTSNPDLNSFVRNAPNVKMMDKSGIKEYPPHHIRQVSFIGAWSEYWRIANNRILNLVVVGLFWLSIGA